MQQGTGQLNRFYFRTKAKTMLSFLDQTGGHYFGYNRIGIGIGSIPASHYISY